MRNVFDTVASRSLHSDEIYDDFRQTEFVMKYQLISRRLLRFVDARNYVFRFAACPSVAIEFLTSIVCIRL